MNNWEASPASGDARQSHAWLRGILQSCTRAHDAMEKVPARAPSQSAAARQVKDPQVLAQTIRELGLNADRSKALQVLLMRHAHPEVRDAARNALGGSPELQALLADLQNLPAGDELNIELLMDAMRREPPHEL